MRMTKHIFAISAVIIITLTYSGCKSPALEADNVHFETVKLVVDDNIIASGDDYKIIEPVWWSVSIEDEERYNSDLEQFSKPQRYVFAIEWYMAEVNNGGHNQFYFNSTGMVWEDAMIGFQAIGAQDNYEILKESANLLGGNPSKNWDKRQEELDKYEPDFEALDSRYYDGEVLMIEKLNAYIKENAKDFYFNGEVRIPKI